MIVAKRLTLWTVALLVLAACVGEPAHADDGAAAGLTIEWIDGFLTIRGDIPGGEIRILYLEAYCRPGSTDREWSETVIGHQTQLVESDEAGKRIKLRDRLTDGVIVDHVITAGVDEVDFQLVARNPTDVESQAHWAQPCIRVGPFTGCSTEDARALVPEYARQCFMFVDGRLAGLPTEPWADQARYVPGQVYRPAHVDPYDVNPRPVSRLTPSNGLIGCYSRDGSKIMAVAWEPYQELFQGVITCIHSDFRIGGLATGESKEIRGKLYVVDSDEQALLTRYQRDFPEHAD